MSLSSVGKILVGVLVSYDMGKAYNSSTGHGAVLGVSKGKVLDFATRCKTWMAAGYSSFFIVPSYVCTPLDPV